MTSERVKRSRLPSFRSRKSQQPLPATSERPPVRVTVLTQILLATLTAGLLPLILISYSALSGFSVASQKSTDSAVRMLDDKSLHELQVQADEAAQSIARFLEGRVDDTLAARLLPRTPEAYAAFASTYTGVIRYPVGSAAHPQEHDERLPLYSEVAFIDARGREQVRVVQGQALPADQLRDVSISANTTFKTETYFTETRALPAGEIYVSPLMAWHTSLPQQPASTREDDAPQGSAYGRYQGVMRFGTPVYDANGQFNGMVLLSLDYRHFLEYVVHIQAAAQKSWTLYGNYASGNYAFVFDQTGYTVAHPLLSRMRGLDSDGRVLSPMAQSMTPEQTAQHPFNMRYAAWSDPNWQTIYDAVLRREHGFAVTTNRASAQKASTYAPIPFNHGAYRLTGLFGGVVIGANVSDFHQSATNIRDAITSEQANQQAAMLWIAASGVCLLIAAAVTISRSITRPIHHLTRAAQAMEQGTLDSTELHAVLGRRIQDEVTALTRVFKQMAEQVHLRERSLKQAIKELRIEIDESKKQEHVVEITETAYFQDLQQRAEALRKKRSGGGT